MSVIGLMITGTSGAGKSTISQRLLQLHSELCLVQAVTTRPARADDEEGTYRYLSVDEFDELDRTDQLLIKANYRNNFYGIAHNDINRVVVDKYLPLIIITPESASQYYDNKANSDNTTFVSVFVDSPDKVLDIRLKSRGTILPDAVNAQRTRDRNYIDFCDHVISNIDLDESVSQLARIWQQAKLDHGIK